MNRNHQQIKRKSQILKQKQLDLIRQEQEQANANSKSNPQSPAARNDDDIIEDIVDAISNINANTITSSNQQQQTWDISIVSTLLFRTIAEALRKSCIDTQKQESAVLLQMEDMNNEMKNLRDALDKYFLDDEPDVLLFEKEEASIRQKFHKIQSKLLQISTKQNAIHQKLRILHDVEQKMVDLQNIYDKELGQLRKNEEDVLKDLKEQKNRRLKAIRIRVAEKSHGNWCMAKLAHTISVASDFETQSEQTFVDDLNGFLKKLKKISENQNNIVRDF